VSSKGARSSEQWGDNEWIPVRLGSSGRMMKVKKDSTRLSISAHVRTLKERDREADRHVYERRIMNDRERETEKESETE
jgi:hypothetical protein